MARRGRSLSAPRRPLSRENWSPKCGLPWLCTGVTHSGCAVWGSPGARPGPPMPPTGDTGHRACTGPVVSKLDLGLLVCAKGLGSNMITPNISAPFLVTLQGLWYLCKCYLTKERFFYFSYSCYRIYTTSAVRLGRGPVACPARFRTRWSRWPGRSREWWMNS